jgi:hypothetical protein
LKDLLIYTFSCDTEIFNGKLVFWEEPVVACVKLIASNLPLDYVEDRDKPLPLEFDRIQISIRDIHPPCRSNRVDIISVSVCDSLMTSFPDISKPKIIKRFLILQWLLLVPFILSCLI